MAAIPYTGIRTPTDPASSITTKHSSAGGYGGPPLSRIHCRRRNHAQHPPQRDARWDGEREGRETKVVPPSPVVPVCTGDFGTNARHPPRERIAHAASDPQARDDVAALPYTNIRTPTDPASSITTTHSRAGGHGGPPLRGIFQRSQVQISKASSPTLCEVGC